MECEGLALEWEACKDLRDRAREKKRILVYPPTKSFCEPTRSNAVDNASVMIPVLLRMSKQPKYALPHLEPLKVEVHIFSNKIGLSLGEKSIYQVAVEIKKLAGFVKRRVGRKEVTKEGVFTNMKGVVF